MKTDAATISITLALLTTATVRAADDWEREIKVGDKTVNLKDPIAKGLDYLAHAQTGAPKKPGDPWEEGPERGSFGHGAYGAHVGITALACLAFMSEGNLPGRGKYGRNV